MYSNVTPPALPDYNPVGLYSYNGVELPALPEWDTAIYPYAYIGTNTTSGNTEFAFFSTPVEATNKNGSFVMSNRDSLGAVYVLQGGAWVSRVVGIYLFRALWCNTDLYYSSTVEEVGGTLCLSASEPVPVLAYPYSVMVYDYEKGAEDWYQVHLYYSATPFTWNGEAVGNSGTVYKRIYDAAYDGWTEEAETEIEASPGLTGTTYQRIYTDHDIKDSAGNIWLAAGSVTEAEEIVTEKWLRSFQAGLALGLTGNAQYMLSTPSYIWDEESGALTVIQDDGSLGFQFDQNTFHMKVTQKQ